MMLNNNIPCNEIRHFEKTAQNYFYTWHIICENSLFWKVCENSKFCIKRDGNFGIWQQRKIEIRQKQRGKQMWLMQSKLKLGGFKLWKNMGITNGCGCIAILFQFRKFYGDPLKFKVLDANEQKQDKSELVFPKCPKQEVQNFLLWKFLDNNYRISEIQLCFGFFKQLIRMKFLDTIGQTRDARLTLSIFSARQCFLVKITVSEYLACKHLLFEVDARFLVASFTKWAVGRVSLG